MCECVEIIYFKYKGIINMQFWEDLHGSVRDKKEKIVSNRKITSNYK